MEFKTWFFLSGNDYDFLRILVDTFKKMLKKAEAWIEIATTDSY